MLPLRPTGFRKANEPNAFRSAHLTPAARTAREVTINARASSAKTCLDSSPLEVDAIKGLRYTMRMCGVAGIWGGTDSNVIHKMVDALRSRGPDDRGTWAGEPHEPVLGHTRLAILDVSKRGAQPMRTSDGRYTLTYNGEVYNHHELRKALRPREYIGNSDTETLLAGFEEWGVESTVRQCVGMFAMGVWDASTRVLHLVRDRLGIKPLYYGRGPRMMAFGSELSAMAASGLERTIDPAAVAELLRYAYVPGDRSIYHSISKVTPGTMLSFEQAGGAPCERRYWSPDTSTLTVRAPVDAVREALQQAVSDRLLSDVPLGVFLSGGIDSSLVTALAQKVSSRPIKTFSIGFDADGYDESSHAALVASHLGTDHHELRISAGVAQQAVPRLADAYSEPFADSSQLPTLLLSEFARQEVVVALSGDGGDEVFGGYNRHIHGPRLAALLRALPSMAKVPAARALERFAGTPAFDSLAPLLARFVSLPKEKLLKIARLMSVSGDGALYDNMTACWTDLEPILAVAPPTRPTRVGSFDGERVRRWDLHGYLPDDILVKLDRASMAMSLEARVPLLDHRVVELGFRIPHRDHVEAGNGKVLLRTLLAEHVPRAYFERPKAGFAVPLASWLRGSLRDWAAALLTTDRLDSVGLRPHAIARAWGEFLGGASTHHRIWAVLMLCAWHERWH